MDRSGGAGGEGLRGMGKDNIKCSSRAGGISPLPLLHSSGPSSGPEELLNQMASSRHWLVRYKIHQPAILVVE